jgi:hypothetical protein
MWLLITGILSTTFNQDFNNRQISRDTYAQVQWSVFDFIVTPILVIASILTTL